MEPLVQPRPGRRRPPRRWLLLVLVVSAFVLGLRLLARGTWELRPLIADEILLLTANEPSAVGAGWLGAYLVLNGSLVAAVALTLFEAGLVGVQELLMLLFGSRFGAAGIVFLVGALDYLERRSLGLVQATSLGMLSFLATFFVGVPALVLARLWTAFGPLARPVEAAELAPSAPPLTFLDPVIGPLLHLGGPWLLFLAGLVVLGASLRGFDRVVRATELERWIEHFRPFLDSRWWMFAAGFLVTLVTTSVAVSIAAAVPLVNRGHVHARSLIPWILGAGVGTFGDTTAVALLLGDPRGISVLLVTIASITLVTVIMLVDHVHAFRAMTAALAWTTATGFRYSLVVTLLVLVPGVAILTGLL